MFKPITFTRTIFLAVVFILGGIIFGAAKPDPEADPLVIGPSFNGATQWLNSPPLSLKELRGKVVLVDFWTYTCINWRRTLPYIREWASKYKEQGLVVIGVHTPEFSFEQKTENVSWSLKDMNISYPVAMDNNYEIWHSFNNQYWPALYLIDAKGKLRYEKFGEGNYEEAELKIRQLLSEASGRNVADTPVALQPLGAELAADWTNLGSPENYIGYGQTNGFASRGGVVPDKPSSYMVPQQLKLNQWALAGEWTMGKERVLLNGKQGTLSYRFHARDLHIVMGPATPGTSIRFRVLINGKAPGAAHGVDVDSDGNGTLNGQRMYQLIRQQGPITDQEFQIEFLDPGAEVYSFTFG